jgi:hypothetical protein
VTAPAVTGRGSNATTGHEEFTVTVVALRPPEGAPWPPPAGVVDALAARLAEGYACGCLERREERRRLHRELPPALRHLFPAAKGKALRDLADHLVKRAREILRDAQEAM